METVIGLDGEKGLSRTGNLKRNLIRSSLIGGAVLWAADIVYRAAADISYVNRQKCILFRILPRPGFLAYEYLIETLIIVFVGTFIAVLIARQSSRLKRFLPGNPVTAFLYGSLIPVCSCAAIPLLSSMKGKMRFQTTMSFVLAAPLLSPYIIVLSFSVLGLKYGVLRILSSFVLVVLTAVVLGAFERRSKSPEAGALAGGCSKSCGPRESDIYLQTFAVFKGLLPFLLAAGALGMALEYFGTRDLMLYGLFGKGAAGIAGWILVGVPFYFCNGAEVLFLRPLMNHGFPVGTGIAFSLTSTAICTTSIAMLFRMIGLKLTLILIGCTVSISFGLALIINHL
ncbi:MAG: permease [bacterium]|jgi:uncharacterized membrane protein YraQ (UPF0718 family)